MTVNVDRTITYTPDHDQKGVDSFTYTICDSHGACDTATVTVTVVDNNKPPKLKNDNASTLSITAVIIDVLANDTDPDDAIDPATLTISKPPAHGTAVVLPDHTISTHRPCCSSARTPSSTRCATRSARAAPPTCTSP